MRPFYNFTKSDIFAHIGNYEDFTDDNADRYYAQWAYDEYGMAVRDNSIAELIAIGMRLERELNV